jgi:hypothetical protein
VQIGLIGLVGLSGFGLISLVNVSGFNLDDLDSLVAAIISAAVFSVVVATHAEATKLTRATKITSKAILYYSDASLHHVYLLVREKMWWWLTHARKKMWWWIASFGYSDHNDVFKYCLATTILAAAAETIPSRCMQAAHGVATMSSTTKSAMLQFIFIANIMLICL